MPIWIQAYLHQVLDYIFLLYSLENIVPQLLYSLCGGDGGESQLAKKQALAKQFAEILNFTLKFDDLKVCSIFFHPRLCCRSKNLELKNDFCVATDSQNLKQYKFSAKNLLEIS